VLRIVQPPRPRIIMQTEAGQIRGVVYSADKHERLQAILRSSRPYRSNVLLTNREGAGR